MRRRFWPAPTTSNAASFFLANAAGAILWAGSVASAAYWFGRQLRESHGVMTYVLAALGIAAVVGSFVYIKRNGAKLAADAEAAFPDPLPGYRTGPSAAS